MKKKKYVTSKFNGTKAKILRNCGRGLVEVRFAGTLETKVVPVDMFKEFSDNPVMLKRGFGSEKRMRQPKPETGPGWQYGGSDNLAFIGTTEEKARTRLYEGKRV